MSKVYILIESSTTGDKVLGACSTYEKARLVEQFCYAKNEDGSYYIVERSLDAMFEDLDDDIEDFLAVLEGLKKFLKEPRSLP